MSAHHGPDRRPGGGAGRGLRRAAWVLLLAVVGLALGGMVAARVGSGPVGQAVVLVPPLAGNAFSVRSGDTLVDLKTESQLPFSDQVLDRVDAPGHSGGAPALRRHLSVRLVDHAEVVVISYRGGTAAAGVAMATRVAEAMLEVRAERAASAYAERAAVLEDALETAESGLVAESNSGQDAEAVAVLGQRIVSLRGELRSVTSNVPSAGSVLATSAPRAPSGRTMRLGVIATSALVFVVVGLWCGGRVRRAGRWLRTRRARRSDAGRDPLRSARAW